MMKFKLIIKFFCLISVIFNYATNDLLSQKVPDIDRAISVKSKKLEKLDNFLNTPYRMSLIFSERYLAITDIDNFPSLHIIKFNSENDYEYYKGMGNEGRGPAEYLSPSDVISDTDHFYVFDSGNMKFVKYNTDFEVVSNEIINLRTDGLPVSVHKYKDNFLLTGINIGSKFEIADLDGKVVSKGGEDLSLGHNIPSRSLALAWHSYSAFSDEKRKIAIFSRGADFAEVFDIDSQNKISEYFNPEYKLPDMRVENRGEMPRLIPNNGAKTSFLWATSNDDKIYALYSGMKSSEENNNYGNLVFVFNWDLQLIEILKLDHLAFSIIVNSDGNLFTTQLYPEPAIRFVELIDL